MVYGNVALSAAATGVWAVARCLYTVISLNDQLNVFLFGLACTLTDLLTFLLAVRFRERQCPSSRLFLEPDYLLRTCGTLVRVGYAGPEFGELVMINRKKARGGVDCNVFSLSSFI